MKFLRIVTLACVAGLLLPNVPAFAQSPQGKPAATQQKPAPAKPRARPAAAPAQPAEPITPSQIGIDTPARQAVVIDANTGTVLLAKDADVPMLPSSMAKMMTIYLLWEEMKAGRVTLDTQYRVSERAWRLQGSKMFVALDSMVAVRDLIQGIIVQSGNDACVVVAEGIAGSEEAFAERMTRKARELGMKNTVFVNASGWPQEGQHTTAHDLAILAQRTIEDFPDFYKRYYAETGFKYENYATQYNRNPLLGRVSGADGLKTGHTEEAGYGLTGSAIRNGRRIIMVVNGLTSMPQRAQESERLIEWAFREFENYTLFKPGEVVEQADVWLGEQTKVPLTVAQAATLTLPRGARDQVKATVIYDGPVPAPIEKGQRLGKLVLTSDALAPMEIPLVAAEPVEKRGVVGRIWAAAWYYLFGAAS